MVKWKNRNMVKWSSVWTHPKEHSYIFPTTYFFIFQNFPTSAFAAIIFSE